MCPLFANTTVGTEFGLLEICRRAGLTKHQVWYIESKGLLGVVRRNVTNDRRFSAAQLEFLLRLATLRASGIGVEEAAALAGEGLAGVPAIPTDRLRFLAARVAQELEPRLRAALVLNELLAKRLSLNGE